MRKYVEYAAFVLFLSFITVQLSSVMYQRAAAGMLSQLSPESDRFREMKFSARFLEHLVEMEEQSGMRAGEILTILLPHRTEGFLTFPDTYSTEAMLKWKQLMLKYNTGGYEEFCSIYGAVFDDLACFPVDEPGMVFENSWMFERNYGGRRGHEGTDLMPPENVPDHYRIRSMTDGTVENVGWLPRGGYRIGIRSPSGGYFYYAHLSSYSTDYKKGDTVAAGEVLGLMGDTGYGEEGTRGKFDVHLHLGIYVRTQHSDELSINPYWVLKYLQIRMQKA